MKSLVLIILMNIFILTGCAPLPPQLTPTTSPEATMTTPTQSPLIEDTGTQLPETPHYEITLLSFNGVVVGPEERHAYIAFSGEFRNDSDVTLDAVEAVITSYNGNNEVIAVDRWRTEPWVIRPGKTGQFGMNVTKYMTAEKFKISFEQLNPSILDLSVVPGVSKTFQLSE